MFSHKVLVFPIEHSRAMCFCYFSYVLFVFVLIFNSLANMKYLKDLLNPLINEETCKMLKLVPRTFEDMGIYRHIYKELLG